MFFSDNFDTLLLGYQTRGRGQLELDTQKHDGEKTWEGKEGGIKKGKWGKRKVEDKKVKNGKEEKETNKKVKK